MSMTRDRFVHYTTGIDIVDAQHWELFTTMDALIVQLKARDNTFVKEHIQHLCDLLAEHFRTEDAIMVAVKYPFIAVHRKAHGEQMAVMHNIEKQLQTPRGSLNEAYISNLSELFVHHIDAHDTQLSDFIVKNGLTKAIRQC